MTLWSQPEAVRGHFNFQFGEVSNLSYTGCPRRKGQNFGRVFLMLKYTDITQNTYVQN
jgi:hypothetical protein